ncbi:hypothetical protein T459_22835 [Capsicum annuum]|uniref:Uncharacterized protein n=1 Tax=Capsicum annuum TaxID=4072 RepID=A0A2G2YQM8_CAPAN|nr:hypothetical protein T459_22835 [Capsicum annuum]
MSMLFKSMEPMGKFLNEDKKLYASINLDIDTTCGAAVLDTILIGNGEENVQELLVVDFTLLELDVETVGRTIIVLISRSATISAKEEQIFPTYSDHQLENNPIEELIRLNYCNWHWQFCGCSVLPVTDYFRVDANLREPFYETEIEAMRPNESNTMFIDFSHVMRFNDVLQKAISDEFLRSVRELLLSIHENGEFSRRR